MRTKKRWGRVGLAGWLAFMVLAGAPAATLANETLRYQVADGADDAEEGNDGPGVIDLTSSDLEITRDGSSKPEQVIGLRFRGVDIPRGTPILGAYLQFSTDEPGKNRNPFSVSIRAQADDDAPAFSETAYDVSGRTRTQASVLWENIPDWTVEHETGPNQRTPDLTALVQEVVNRDGWNAGNALAFILEGVGTRTAESYEGSIDDVEVADLAPQLIVIVPSRVAYRVSSSTDDAEERLSDGRMDITSSDLEIIKDNADQVLGIRFRNATLPRGAQILSAYIQFGVDENNRDEDPFNVTIWAEDVDDAATYGSAAGNISSRVKTAASVLWSNAPLWTVVGAAGPEQRTPELSSLVQAIVDREGWQEGNALAFILGGEGRRVAEAFDGDATLAPVLHVSFIGEQRSPSVDKIRLAWSDDPATTMTVIWNQTRGSDPRVHYAPYVAAEGCSSDLATYTGQQGPTRVVPDYREMNNHFAKLSGLTPDSAYRFVIADSEGVSRCSWFRTAPDAPQPFTFISGGDTKSSGTALQAGRWSNEMVAKLRPLFVFFTGDFLSGDGTSSADWIQWLNDWTTQTRSADDRIYPIIAVHGNHEDGDFEVLYNLFDAGNTDPAQPANYAYYALSVGGDLLRIINLNSQLWLNGKVAAHEQQIQWLAQELAANRDHTFKVAGYHKPIRPHTQSKAENDHQLAWADLFDQYGLSIAFESDTHNHKITFPLRRSDAPGNVMGFVRDDANGTMYVGEGSWGATPRPNNDDKSWTLHSESINQLKWHQVFPATAETPARIDMRTVVTGRYVGGVLTNFVEGVEALTEDDLFREPAGITLAGVPFYGDVISVPFTALSGEAPTAPASLTGTATSYTDVTIAWTNTAEAGQVSSLEIERRVGAEGEWAVVASGLPPTTTSFSQENLPNGTDYFYRVRAVNVFGISPWSEEVQVSTPVDPRLAARFQQGLDGYAGNENRVIAQRSPDASFVAAEFSIDLATSDYGGPDGASQGLIRFNEVFGTAGLPAGARISEATLRFWTTSSTNGPVGLHRMLTPWDENTSWNTLGNGIQADDVEAATDADDAKVNISSGRAVVFDVTASVKAWAAGASNQGWAVLNQSGDGWDYYTDQYAGSLLEERRPLLTVFYVLPGDGDGDGDVDANDLALIRAALRQPASGPDDARDVDGDGLITVLDLRQATLRCTRSRCATE